MSIKLEALISKKGECSVIMKIKIPILGFDKDTTAVIMSTHEDLNLNLPSEAVFAFLKTVLMYLQIIVEPNRSGNSNRQQKKW